MSYLDNAYGMRELQQLLLDMMLDLDAICRKHGIEYSLLGGTMLGAVRDGGFIPWDDDIDLAFTRDALEKLSRVLPEETNRYELTFEDTWVARLVPKEPVNGQRPFLDLFHYESISVSPAKQKIKVLFLQLLQGMLKEDADLTRFSRKNRLLLRTTHALGKLFSKKAKLRMYRWIGSHLCMGDGTLLHIPDEQFACVGLTYPQAYAQAFQDISFEGYPLRVSRYYHEMLVIHYGDYMTPPPASERKSKHDGQRRAKGERA